MADGAEGGESGGAEYARLALSPKEILRFRSIGLQHSHRSHRLKSLILGLFLSAAAAGFAQGADPAKTTGKDPGAASQDAARDAATIAVPTRIHNDSDKPDHSTDTSATFRLGAGDLVEVKVFNVPELTSEMRVTGDGNISLALVGSVHIADLTTPEAERAIHDKLVDGGFLRNPQVTVFVKEFVTQGVSVLGEVNKPGIYPLLGARRMFDAISAAGGLTDKAGRVVTIARRDKPDEPLSITMDKNAAKSTASNVEIFPGDTILVSKAGVVYVVGEVGRPSGFIMDNNESLTVLQAIALAQGLGRDAKLKESKIIRKTPEGLKEMLFDLGKLLEGKQSDIAMQNEDILFIPRNGAKAAARRSLEAIVQAATGVAIYRR